MEKFLASVLVYLKRWVSSDKEILILKIAAVCIFLGRAWQYIVKDAPYREIFWNDALINPILAWFNYPVNQWFLNSDPYITRFIQILGATYLVCAFSAWKIKKFKSIHTYLLAWGVLNLFLLTYLIYRSKLYTMGMFIEHTIQWTTPLFLILYIRRPGPYLSWMMKGAIALTFAGHGMYAIGYYQVPGDYIAMVIGSTPIADWKAATIFLITAGVLDFIVSAAVFIPRIDVFALGYAAVWGVLTALARIVAFFDPYMVWNSTSTWLHETIFRLPHGLVPLVCLLMILNSRKPQNGQNSPSN